MFVVFRVDASLEIGIGHVMRCLTLADALRENGAECLFVCRLHQGNLVEAIQSRGFNTEALPLGFCSIELSGDAAQEHQGWLGDSWKHDAIQTLACISDRRPDWIVVDHYAIGAQWEREISVGSRRVMVIDDLANRRHDCDLLLDQNLGRCEESYRNLLHDECQVLAGPQFALLRKEFSKIRESSLSRRQKPKLDRLLIAMGGVDKNNATGTILDAISKSSISHECQIIVVLGKHSPWIDQVRSIAMSMPWQVDIHVDTPDIAGLMAQSDFAIGGAGSTSWERCCLGLPAIQVVLASNQREIAVALQAARAAVTVEYSELASNIVMVLDSIFTNPSLIKQMSSSAAVITSGHGALRVSEYMSKVMVDEN